MSEIVPQQAPPIAVPPVRRIYNAIKNHPYYTAGGGGGILSTFALLKFAETYPNLTNILHPLAGVSVLITFHCFEKLYSEEQARRRAEKTVDDIAKKMSSGITSLNQLNTAHVKEVYADRIQAQKLMAEAISKPGNQELLLMGVSLNDFLSTGIHSPMSELSSSFKSFVANNDTNVRLLLIDPNSDAAELRETAEEANANLKRLEREVQLSIEMLDNLIVSRADTDDTRLQYRLYRSVPTLFILMTNFECFVQPYYFWSRRGSSRELPMFHITIADKCDGISKLLDDGDRSKFKADNDSYNGTLSHFDWIWHSCSITADQHQNLLADAGKQAKRENLKAIYSAYPEEFGIKRISRIIKAIEGAKERIWILGFTLKFFFDNSATNRALLHAAKRLAENCIKTKSDDPNSVDPVRVLVIDPLCEEAKLRMFRERDLDPGDAEPPKEFTNHDGFRKEFEKFKEDSKVIESMTLFKDVTDTLTRARDNERRFKKRQSLPSTDKLLAIRQFEHFPACFMCLVDDTVFVEQYHYGEGQQGELGKDMPILEFNKNDTSNKEKLPYELLESHFEFIWKISREVP